MLIVILTILVLFFIIKHKWKRGKLKDLAHKLRSSYRKFPFIGHSYLFIGGEEHRMKSLQLLGIDAIKHGGIISFWHASEVFIFVADPEAAETILNNCLEKGDVVKLTRPVMGNGSIFAPVSIWRPRRKVLAPTTWFSSKHLVKFVNIFVRQASNMVDNMRQAAGKGTFSIWKICSAFTMDSVCETTLGVEINAQSCCDRPFLKAMDVLNNVAALRLCRPWLHSDFIFTRTSHWRTAMKEKAVVFNFINEVIKEKREELMKNQNTDCLKTFLEMLMKSADKGYTDVELQEEVLVIVLAGTDSAAVATAFTIVLLSRHPDIQERVYLELQEIFGDSDRNLEVQDLPKLVYLEAVIKETLRLYPPAPAIVRKVEKDIELPSGVTLVKDCTAVIHIWAIHRNPQYWGDDADKFRPQRFMDSQLTHPVQFVPFSHGPRGCLGYRSRVANAVFIDIIAYMMSMKTALATLLRQYRVLPPTDLNPSENKLRVKFDIMLRDADGYLVQLDPRT